MRLQAVGGKTSADALYTPYRMPDDSTLDATCTFTQRTFKEKLTSDKEGTDNSTLEFVKNVPCGLQVSKSL